MAYRVVFLPGWSLVARRAFGVDAVRFFAAHLSAKHVTRNLILGGRFGAFGFSPQPDLTTCAVSLFAPRLHHHRQPRDQKKRCRLLSCIIPASVANLIFTRCSVRALREELCFAPGTYISWSGHAAAMKRVRNERSTPHLPYRASRNCTDGETASHPRVLASRHRSHKESRRAAAPSTRRPRSHVPPQLTQRFPLHAGPRSTGSRRSRRRSTRARSSSPRSGGSTRTSSTSRSRTTTPCSRS